MTTNNIMNFLTLTAETVDEFKHFITVRRTYALGADREIRVCFRASDIRSLKNRVTVHAAIRDPHIVEWYDGETDRVSEEEWRTEYIGERNLGCEPRSGWNFDNEIPTDLVAMAWGLLMHWQA